jgi:hypothetical protein
MMEYDCGVPEGERTSKKNVPWTSELVCVIPAVELEMLPSGARTVRVASSGASKITLRDEPSARKTSTSDPLESAPHTVPDAGFAV